MIEMFVINPPLKKMRNRIREKIEKRRRPAMMGVPGGEFFHGSEPVGSGQRFDNAVRREREERIREEEVKRQKEMQKLHYFQQREVLRKEMEEAQKFVTTSGTWACDETLGTPLSFDLEGFVTAQGKRVEKPEGQPIKPGERFVTSDGMVIQNNGKHTLYFDIEGGVAQFRAVDGPPVVRKETYREWARRLEREHAELMEKTDPFNYDKELFGRTYPESERRPSRWRRFLGWKTLLFGAAVSAGSYLLFTEAFHYAFHWWVKQ